MNTWQPTPWYAHDLGVPHTSQLGNSIPNDCGAGALVSVVRRYNPASALTVEQAYRAGVPQEEWGRGMMLFEVQRIMFAHDVPTVQRAGMSALDLIACLLAKKPVILLIDYAPFVDARLTQFTNFRGQHYVTVSGSDLSTFFVVDPYADSEHGRYRVPVEVLLQAWQTCSPPSVGIVPVKGLDFSNAPNPPEEGNEESYYQMVEQVKNGLIIRAEPSGTSKNLGILKKAETPRVYVTGKPVNGYIKLKDKPGWVWFALLKKCC